MSAHPWATPATASYEPALCEDIPIEQTNLMEALIPSEIPAAQGCAAVFNRFTRLKRGEAKIAFFASRL